MSYYGKAYNSYGLDRPMRVGDVVTLTEETRSGFPTTYATGRIVRFDNRKATDGYTVLVEVEPGTDIWFRPDELRESLTPEGRARVWTATYALTAREENEARYYITERALADVPDATVEFIRGPIRDRGPRSYWRATVRRTRTTEEA